MGPKQKRLGSAKHEQSFYQRKVKANLVRLRTCNMHFEDTNAVGHDSCRVARDTGDHWDARRPVGASSAGRPRGGPADTMQQ